MIQGIQYDVGGLRTGVNLAGFLTPEGTTANLKLPERGVLEAVDAFTLRLLYAEFSPELLYGGDVESSMGGWQFLTEQNVDLGTAAVLLGVDEIGKMLAFRYWPAASAQAYLADVACLTQRLRAKGVRNFEHQIPKMRRKIGGGDHKGAIRAALENIRVGPALVTAANPLRDAVLGVRSELSFCWNAAAAGFDAAFNKSSEGHDLTIDGETVKIEVTLRQERFNLDEHLAWLAQAERDPASAVAALRADALLTGFSLAVADKIEHELKQGQIAAVDATTLVEGFSMLALKHFSIDPESLSVKTAIDKALEISRLGEQAVIFLARGRHAAAYCVEASAVLRCIEELERAAPGLVSQRRKRPMGTYRALADALRDGDLQR